MQLFREGAHRVATKSTAQWLFASLLGAAALQLIGYGLRVIAECLWSCAAISTLDHWKLPDFGADDRVVPFVFLAFAALLAACQWLWTRPTPRR